MKSITEIEARLNDTARGIGHDMAPPVVNATRVAYVQALNWVLDNPISEDTLDAMWHEFAGITQKEIE
jgi:hypothetical protein